jgi:uncharacterized protein YndB with AHSA1/START domain
MTAVRKLRFRTHINAPVERVWEMMLGPDSYRQWTSAFVEGSYFEGSWDEGATIRFLSPSGDGMVAIIAENRPHERISIRHVGIIAAGVEDRESDQIRAWAPAFENYTFRPVDGGTEVAIEQDVAEDFEQHMLDMWPRALETSCTTLPDPTIVSTERICLISSSGTRSSRGRARPDLRACRARSSRSVFHAQEPGVAVS